MTQMMLLMLMMMTTMKEVQQDVAKQGVYCILFC